jgi:putative PIN family toxin of toxin-antitoxin system
VRAVLDANVLVYAVLSRTGAPALLVERCALGDFDLVASELLLGEVERTLRSPKIRSRIEAGLVDDYVAWLRELADVEPDVQEPPPVRSADPGDDYLIALAAVHRATIVSGDQHLLSLRALIPVRSPREFLDGLPEAP